MRGLDIHLLGRLAVIGDSVDIDGLRFEVQSANARQIKMVRVSRIIEGE